jgi:hypothetical protein
MKAILSASGSLAQGLVSGLFVVLALAIVSGLTFPRARVVQVARNALASGELAFDEHRDEDYFTECALLTMQYARASGLFRNAIETRYAEGTRHPCQELESLVSTGKMSDGSIAPVGAYRNYPFGSRFLEALVLSVLDLRTAKSLYAFLSFGSVLVLIAGAFRNSPSTALTVLPIGFFLLFGFSMHRFGHNLAHAPGFFLGFTALGVFLAARDRFRNSAARVMFFGFLGVVIASFDLMHGSIPVVLSLAIVLSHLFYVAPALRADATLSPGGYWLVALREAVVICVCFLVAYGTITAGRLLLLSTITDGSWRGYGVALGSRLGQEVSGVVINIDDVIEKLWLARFQLMPGGLTPSTWMLVVALTAWIFTICLLPIASWRRDRASLVLLADLSVIVLAAAGALAWYRLFRQHTFIHVLFVVRIAALPASFGLVAAALVVRSLADAQSRALRWAPAVCAVVSFVAAAWLLEGTISVVTSARVADQPLVDEVSCAALGLRRDGKPDGLIELGVRTTQVSPPLAAIGWRPRDFGQLYLRLERTSPPGWWETGAGVYVLGITVRPDSELINKSDGRVLVPPQHPVLFLHFCRDGHDTPESRYRLYVGDTSVPVEQGR